MRKIEKEYENFIDDYLLDFAEYISPYLKKLKFTPNIITSFSLVTGLASIYYLYNKNIILFAVLWIFSYFLDCLDGHFARKYDMVTTFGDWYDHVKDVVVYLTLTIMSYIMFKHNKYIYIVYTVIFLIFLLNYIHLTCQQILFTGIDSNEEFLDLLKGLLKYFNVNNESCKDIIHYTKYFGSGTLIVFTLALIIFLYFSKPVNKN